MTTPAPTDPVIDALDRVAQDTFAWFDGIGRTTAARVDRWQARDVLQHFIYFHDATAWGMQSVALGGPPWPLAADADRHLAPLEQIDVSADIDTGAAPWKVGHGNSPAVGELR